MFNIDEDELKLIDEMETSSKEKMEKCFQVKRNKITWNQLRQNLTALKDCSKIIEYLRSETLLATGTCHKSTLPKSPWCVDGLKEEKNLLLYY